jgi:hypothetical protein
MISVMIEFLVCKDMSLKVGDTLRMNVWNAVFSRGSASQTLDQLVHDERLNFRSVKTSGFVYKLAHCNTWS